MYYMQERIWCCKIHTERETLAAYRIDIVSQHLYCITLFHKVSRGLTTMLFIAVTARIHLHKAQGTEAEKGLAQAGRNHGFFSSTAAMFIDFNSAG